MHENAFFNKSIVVCVLVMGGGVGLSNFGFLVWIGLHWTSSRNFRKSWKNYQQIGEKWGKCLASHMYSI